MLLLERVVFLLRDVDRESLTAWWLALLARREVGHGSAGWRRLGGAGGAAAEVR